MKFLIFHLAIMFTLLAPDSGDPSANHTTNSGEINLVTLEQIEGLICKKTGIEFGNSENSFSLNGYYVSTQAIIRKYGANIYKESFYKIEKPKNIYKMQLIKHPDGSWELAVLIKNNDGVINYHAAFDSKGIMLEEDPWGKSENYSIKTFDLYSQYQHIFAQEVDAINYATK